MTYIVTDLDTGMFLSFDCGAELDEYERFGGKQTFFPALYQAISYVKNDGDTIERAAGYAAWKYVAPNIDAIKPIKQAIMRSLSNL